LINSLLHFCRLGQENLAYEDTDLSVVVQEVLNLLYITLTQQRIEVRMPQPLPVVRCDRSRVREVFHNLILNAIKYNDKPHKWVEISVLPSPSVGMTPSPTFYVRDNGLGIRPHHMEMIFAMFKRLHPRDDYGGGTGTGLSIAKKNYRTPWRESLGGVDLWRRLNLLLYAARECHALWRRMTAGGFSCSKTALKIIRWRSIFRGGVTDRPIMRCRDPERRSP
jgi:signal transduction histidine kinase